MGEILVRLQTQISGDVLSKHLLFDDDLGQKINHGVASGMLFSAMASKIASLSSQPAELPTCMKWAGAAMALHSLKKPGIAENVQIQLEKDPLSYLLMICDEIQVWDRERPDADMSKSHFKGAELVDFLIADDSITAKIALILYENVDVGHVHYKDELRAMNNSFVEDEQVLSKYVKAENLKIVIEREIPPPNDHKFSNVSF